MEDRARIKELPNPDAPRLPVIEECTGCHYVFMAPNGGPSVCVPYWNPAAKWRLGCPMATNRVVEKVEQKKVNPLKASKKAKKGA
jgi:hypothetical protein